MSETHLPFATFQFLFAFKFSIKFPHTRRACSCGRQCMSNLSFSLSLELNAAWGALPLFSTSKILEMLTLIFCHFFFPLFPSLMTRIKVDVLRGVYERRSIERVKGPLTGIGRYFCQPLFFLFLVSAFPSPSIYPFLFLLIPNSLVLPLLLYTLRLRKLLPFCWRFRLR